jgi:hypothetical protein
MTIIPREKGVYCIVETVNDDDVVDNQPYEDNLGWLINEHKVDEGIFQYSTDIG